MGHACTDGKEVINTAPISANGICHQANANRLVNTDTKAEPKAPKARLMVAKNTDELTHIKGCGCSHWCDLGLCAAGEAASELTGYV
jgi:predicted flap endonuclease-1-like 5' DNA nuclease